MIRVTRLNGKVFYINAELIQKIESTPDTIITLTTDAKLIVKEDSETIINRVIDYKRQIISNNVYHKE